MIRSRLMAGAMWAAGSVVIALGARAVGDDPPPQREALTLRDAIKTLIDEGRRSWREPALVRAKPDFAGEFAVAAPPEEVMAALLEPAHRDPFIDAYVRWQLTSFDPSLPEMDERAFIRFMNSVPALNPNPRSEPQTVRSFEAAEQAGPLRERDLQAAHEMAAALDRASTAAEARNQPALQLRDFIAAKLGDFGHRPRLWLLERCAAHIRAGWSVRTIKAELTRSFTAAAADESLTDEQRAFIAEQARGLVGMKARFLGEITFLANGSLRAQFSTAEVDEQDVEQWIARMNGTHRP